MSVELHLPDLPEVPISLGAVRGAPPRPRPPWTVRLREALAGYLPLLMMGVLALGTLWLVRVTPKPSAAPAERAARTAPDYTMSGFTLERFGPDGSLRLRMEGARMRHFPDVDRIEVDDIRLRSVAPDGRVTEARAQRAIANGDGSEVQLVGGAEVDGVDARGEPLAMRSEFLHAFLASERLRTHLPVVVTRGGSEIRAAGLDYEHAAGRLELKGPMRLTLVPAAATR
ncbi:MAG: LPS export ABC transporter periplasmic protein LptC [Rubrivivax sp.]|jgi:lipopolysaccharide export system protein LptC|nr:LPS export ABC transporter periplasmic protein LptC [Rubrivivax sp.]